MSNDLLAARLGQTQVLTLNRPHRRNALSTELIDALAVALADTEADAAIRAVVLAGTPPAFCAGLDLHELLPDDEREVDISGFTALLEQLARLAKPTIAAVNGAAVAGGAALVTTCDLAIAGSRATFGYPGIRRGLVAPVVMPSLRAVAGRHAADLLLTGRVVPAWEARGMSLINAVVPDSQCLEHALEIAGMFADIPPAALRATKQHLRDARTGQISAAHNYLFRQGGGPGA